MLKDCIHKYTLSSKYEMKVIYINATDKLIKKNITEIK